MGEKLKKSFKRFKIVQITLFKYQKKSNCLNVKVSKCLRVKMSKKSRKTGGALNGIFAETDADFVHSRIKLRQFGIVIEKIKLLVS